MFHFKIMSDDEFYKEIEEIPKEREEILYKMNKKLRKIDYPWEFPEKKVICDQKLEFEIVQLIQANQLNIDKLHELFPKEMPSFSEHFIEFFFEYVETKDENILEIADAFCFNAENCTNLFKQGLLEILFSFLPSSFDLIFKILSNANENAISWFNEIGGLHPMILMSSDPSLLDIISQILYLMSSKDIPNLLEVPPPSSELYEIVLSYDNLETLQFSDLLINLRNCDNYDIINRLFYSLARIFKRSDEAAESLGPAVLAEFPEIFDTPEIAISALNAASECIAVAEIEDPLFFIDALAEMLGSEDVDLVPAAINLAVQTIKRFGLEMFESSPAIDQLFHLCSDSPFSIKEKAIESMILVSESCSTSDAHVLINMGFIEMLVDYVDSLADQTIPTILSSLTNFLGTCLMLEYDTETENHISNGIEEIEKMMDHDSHEVNSKALTCYEKLKPFYEEWI